MHTRNGGSIGFGRGGEGPALRRVARAEHLECDVRRAFLPRNASGSTLDWYPALGVRELVTFHVEAEPGQRLRVWDRLEHDLVERVVTGDTTPCLTLGLTVLVGPVDGYPVALRLARDAEGCDLVLTKDERRLAVVAERDAAEGDRDAVARANDLEVAARTRAEERIAELEKELAARGPR